ncbi:unnamed protein product [Citrullus colocynthis]|uniref:Uncharacterized protein n=1 Tax=Citrullus colocynthis TaxID=252529 RepID=A0ABP0Y1R8_9ROSI
MRLTMPDSHDLPSGERFKSLNPSIKSLHSSRQNSGRGLSFGQRSVFPLYHIHNRSFLGKMHFSHSTMAEDQRGFRDLSSPSSTAFRSLRLLRRSHRRPFGKSHFHSSPDRSCSISFPPQILTLNFTKPKDATRIMTSVQSVSSKFSSSKSESANPPSEKLEFGELENCFFQPSLRFRTILNSDIFERIRKIELNRKYRARKTIRGSLIAIATVTRRAGWASDDVSLKNKKCAFHLSLNESSNSDSESQASIAELPFFRFISLSQLISPFSQIPSSLSLLHVSVFLSFP